MHRLGRCRTYPGPRASVNAGASDTVSCLEKILKAHVSLFVVVAIAVGSFACRSAAPTVEMTNSTAAPIPSLSSTASQASAEQREAAPVLELRLVGESAELPEYPTMDGSKLRLEKDAVVSAKDIASARTIGATVHVKLTPEASASFEDATRRHRGRRLAIVVNGEVAQAPEIRSAIAGGNLSIDTRNEEDASALVEALRPPH